MAAVAALYQTALARRQAPGGDREDARVRRGCGAALVGFEGVVLVRPA